MRKYGDRTPIHDARDPLETMAATRRREQVVLEDLGRHLVWIARYTEPHVACEQAVRRDEREKVLSSRMCGAINMTRRLEREMLDE